MKTQKKKTRLPSLMAALLLSITGAAHAQVVPNSDFASCVATTPRYPVLIDNANATMKVYVYDVTYGANPSPDACPGWTFIKGSSNTYVTVVQSNTTAPNPPAVGTKAIWLNEVGASASTTVTGLIPGQTYTLSVDAWLDDRKFDTALKADLGGSTGTLTLPLSSGQKTLSVDLCAKTSTAPLVLTEASTTVASPVFTNVRLVDAKKPCAGMFTVGGTLSGLAKTQSIVLLNNAGNPITLSANGSFTFPGALNDASAYAVTVGKQPTNQVCTVAFSQGSIASAHVTNVSVSCGASTIGVPVNSPWMLLLATLGVAGLATRWRRKG